MKKEVLRRYLAESGRTPRLVCNFSEEEFPFIILAETEKWDTMCLRVDLMCLPETEVLTIGRNAEKKTLCIPRISRLHCYITKEGSNYALYDVSKYGTRVLSMTKTPHIAKNLKEKIKDFLTF